MCAFTEPGVPASNVPEPLPSKQTRPDELSLLSKVPVQVPPPLEVQSESTVHKSHEYWQ